MTDFFITILILQTIFYINCGIVLSKACLSNKETVYWYRYFHVENSTLPIIIDVADRASQKILSNILKILLTERLRYKNVVIQSIPKLNSSEILNRLVGHKDSLPKAHINLEIWQLPGFNVEAWVNKGLLVDCGPLGPISRRGLFTLTEDVKGIFSNQPEENMCFDHWRVFQQRSPSVNFTQLYNWLTTNGNWLPVNTFAKSELYRLPIILLEDSEHEKPLKELFRKLSLNYSSLIVMAGNGSTNLQLTIDQWINHSSQIPNRFTISPLYFYHWYPSTITVKRNYSRVLFPDCYGIGDDPLCEFEVNQLSKMVWVKVKSHASLAYQLVSRFKISQAELVSFLNKVNARSTDEQIFEVACDWVTRNKLVWEPWTTGWNVTDKLIIPGLFPLYGKWVPENISKISLKEVEVQNKKWFHNSSYELELQILNLTCVEDIVLKEYLKYSAEHSNSIILAYLAAVSSDALESVLKVSTFQRRIIVTSTADSPHFGNVSQYRYIFRTIPSMKLQMHFLLKIFTEWRWKRIVILRKDSMFYDAQFFEATNIKVIDDYKQEESTLTFQVVYDFLLRIRDGNRGRIFLVEYFSEATRTIMCAAYKLGMSLQNGYVWFLNPWLEIKWNHYKTDNCTAEEIWSISSKYLTVTHRNSKTFPNFHDYSAKGMQVDNKTDEFVHFTVDAIRRIAEATRRLINETPSALSILDSPNVAQKLISYISKTSNSDKIRRRSQIDDGYWIIFGMNHNKSIPIFRWDINVKDSEGNVDKSTSHLILMDKRNLGMFWSKSNNFLPPDDGSLISSKSDCMVDSFMRFTGLSCSLSIIVLNIIIMIPILIGIIGLFVFLIRRLKKNQEEEGMRRPFEFICDELSDLDIPQKDIVINREVGRGNFGTVFGGEARKDNKWVSVAIKVISKKLDYRTKYDFLSEAKLMSNFNHENIVKLIGICLHPNDEHIFLIMEHVTGGDLKKFLIKRRVKAKEFPHNEQISPKKLTKYARDIAAGLEYLHQNRYLHRDVACRNCLIDPDAGIKVGDFGLARKISKFSRKGGSAYYRFSGLGAMPIRWLPPESLQYGYYSVASDIWSYGVTLYEIVTFGKFPFSEYQDEEVVDSVKRGHFNVSYFLPSSFKQEKVFSIISKCCNYRDSDRYKSMQDIIDIFDSHTECIVPYLSDNLTSSQPSKMLSPSNSFHSSQKRPTSKDSRFFSESSATYPHYIEVVSTDSEVPKQLHENTDFLNAFVGLDCPTRSSLTDNQEKPVAVKSQSIEYIHLDIAPNNEPNNHSIDPESDLGYVTYKNDESHSPAAESGVHGNPIMQPCAYQNNYITATPNPINNLIDQTLCDVEMRPDKAALTKCSYSLDLSTDTGCSETTDCTIDKSSPDAQQPLQHYINTSDM